MAKHVEDQEPSLGQEIIAALTQVLEAHESGDPANHPGVTVRRVEVREPPLFSARQIKAVREKTGLSQHAFAVIVGNAPLTIQRWERGQSKPGPTARRLLEFIDEAPERAASRFTSVRLGKARG